MESDDSAMGDVFVMVTPGRRKSSIVLPEMPPTLANAMTNMRKSITNLQKSPWMLSRSNDIQTQVESISDLLRSGDNIKVVIKLENNNRNITTTRYLVIVSTTVSQNNENREECALLGVDVEEHVDADEDNSMMITSRVGLVLPINHNLIVNLEGDGGFTVTTRERQSPYWFKPTSVQAMWSVLQCLRRILKTERSLPRHSIVEQRFTWTAFYKSPALASSQLCIDEWNRMQEIEILKEDRLHINLPPDECQTVHTIRLKIKDVMRKATDFTQLTCKDVRLALEKDMNMDLTSYKNVINEDMIIVMGQMDSASKIFSYLYLGSEYNASNLEELQQNRVGSIVNVTVEIDNFFPGMFNYFNVRVTDEEQSELMKYWRKTYEFISKARKKKTRVLVHCRMGISRSASTVIAFAMKEYGWSLERALQYVQKRRPIVKPNPGFMKQLFVYEGILNANKFHPRKMLMRCRSCSAENLDSLGNDDDEEEEEDQLDTVQETLQDSCPTASEIKDTAKPDLPPTAVRPCFLMKSLKSGNHSESKDRAEAQTQRRPSQGIALTLHTLRRSASWPSIYRQPTSRQMSEATERQPVDLPTPTTDVLHFLGSQSPPPDQFDEASLLNFRRHRSVGIQRSSTVSH